MSELARRRRARDLWISRGHVGAAVAAAGLLAVIAFSVGVLAGRSGHAAVPATTHAWGDVPDDSLVTLLARVEASSHPDGGAEELTFPDALYREGGPEVQLPDPLAVAPTESSTIPAADVAPVAIGGSPGFTVEVVRTDREDEATRVAGELAPLGAWVRTERVGETTTWRVGVGHHGSQADADAWLAEHAAELPGSAVVVKLDP